MQIELFKQILKQYDFIDFALLFGSYAKGIQTALSERGFFTVSDDGNEK